MFELICLFVFSQDSIALDALFFLQSLVFMFIVTVQCILVYVRLFLERLRLHFFSSALFLRETSIALDALFLFEHAAADDAKGEAEDRHCNR